MSKITIDDVPLVQGQQWLAGTVLVDIIAISDQRQVWLSSPEVPSAQRSEADVQQWFRASGARLVHAADAPHESYYERLRVAFGKVHNRENWKYNIDAVVPAADLVDTIRAIQFMTSSNCEVSPQDDGTFRVKAPGYYASCGA